jgi:hypothetical protein
MHEWAAADEPNEVIADEMVRKIPLALREIPEELGPPVESHELQNFVWEHQAEIEAAGREFLILFRAMARVH